MYQDKINQYRQKKKKNKRSSSSQINFLLNIETNPRKTEILQQLKKCNKIAYSTMMKNHLTWKEKYHLLQKLSVWKKAKQLIIQFKDDLSCPVCNSNVANDFVMHHDKYVTTEMFTPTFIKLVHHKCHEKEHGY